ncbi:Uncharacterised protein [Segatella copri]|nr:Uncharacterised protein [Segatella copri]
MICQCYVVFTCRANRWSNDRMRSALAPFWRYGKRIRVQSLKERYAICLQTEG